MQTVNSHLPPPNPKSMIANSPGTDHMDLIPMSAIKLAKLNIGLFSQLRHLGTSKARICAVFNLSEEEYDYINQLC